MTCQRSKILVIHVPFLHLIFCSLIYDALLWRCVFTNFYASGSRSFWNSHQKNSWNRKGSIEAKLNQRWLRLPWALKYTGRSYFFNFQFNSVLIFFKFPTKTKLPEIIYISLKRLQTHRERDTNQILFWTEKIMYLIFIKKVRRLCVKEG